MFGYPLFTMADPSWAPVDIRTTAHCDTKRTADPDPTAKIHREHFALRKQNSTSCYQFCYPTPDQHNNL